MSMTVNLCAHNVKNNQLFNFLRQNKLVSTWPTLTQFKSEFNRDCSAGQCRSTGCHTGNVLLVGYVKVYNMQM